MSKAQKEKAGTVIEGTEAAKRERPVCGIVMPISACDGCSEAHWIDVKTIISSAVDEIGFEANLVSVANDVGVIHKRIIQNLYENPIVVVDVSGRNPNVMFELGVRLTFDKPIIIIKDDKTDYTFDTSSIEHLEYPRDLRFGKVLDFKKELGRRIQATMKKSSEDLEYSPFLKTFGTFKVPKLQTEEVSQETFIISELKEIKLLLGRQDVRNRPSSPIVTTEGRTYSIPSTTESLTQSAKMVVNNIIEQNSNIMNSDGGKELLYKQAITELTSILNRAKTKFSPGTIHNAVNYAVTQREFDDL